MKKRLILWGLCLALLLTLIPGKALAYSTGDGTPTTVSAGYGQAAVIDRDGSLWVWGDNRYGQIGNGLTGNAVDPHGYYGPYEEDTETYLPSYYQSVPQKIMDDVVSVSAGGVHQGNFGINVITAAVKTDGSLWAWGSAPLINGKGDATVTNYTNVTYDLQTKPAQIIDSDVRSVSVGGLCMAVIKTDGSLWAWGDMGYGEDGDVYYESPVRIMEDVASVCAGTWCVAAVKTDGTLWMWGLDAFWWEEEGGMPELTVTPQKLMDNVVSVTIGANQDSFGSNDVVVTRTDGSLWAWGPTFGYVPKKLMDGVASAAAGYGQFAVVKTDGSLWMWGQNACGQLGNGLQSNSSVPVKIMDHVTSAACGYNFTAAVRDDGSVWTWGENTNGQLGDGGGGDATDYYGGVRICRSSPVAASGLNVLTPGQAPVSSCLVTFTDGQTGGVLDTRRVQYGGTVGTLPAAPAHEGYTFQGWYDAKGDQVTVSTKVTGDMTVYARYQEKSSTSNLTFRFGFDKMTFDPAKGTAVIPVEVLMNGIPVTTIDITITLSLN